MRRSELLGTKPAVTEPTSQLGNLLVLIVLTYGCNFPWECNEQLVYRACPPTVFTEFSPLGKSLVQFLLL